MVATTKSRNDVHVRKLSRNKTVTVQKHAEPARSSHDVAAVVKGYLGASGTL